MGNVIDQIETWDDLKFIEKLKFRFGSTKGQPELMLDHPEMVIFVGPNNSGKSKILREIYSDLTNIERQDRNVILDRVYTCDLTPKHLKTIADHVHRNCIEEFKIVFKRQFPAGDQPKLDEILSFLNKQIMRTSDDQARISQLFSFTRSIVEQHCSSRLRLLNEQTRGDLLRPDSQFSRLFRDKELKKDLKEFINKEVGFHFALDVWKGNAISIKFGRSPAPNEEFPSEELKSWLENANSSDEISDGTKAFIGLTLSLSTEPWKVLFLDEPESHLHPSLVYNLGKTIGTTVRKKNRQAFCSTHNADFIMGAIQSGVNVTLIRLTHGESDSTARQIPASNIKKLMTDPMLRSSNVISGVFHKTVIVTEAAADRAFYQEINDRLLASNDPRGIENALFLNAVGKDTIHQLVSPLRRLGIPTAIIGDIDCLEQGGTNWIQFLSSSGLPQPQHSAFQDQRKVIWDKMNAAANKKVKAEGGIDLLKGADKESAKNLLAQLNEYGFFLVPSGEVEHWLQNIRINRGKNSWLKSIFDVMGNNPENSNYVVPAQGDVWDFLGNISKWATNPERKGIPISND